MYGQRTLKADIQRQYNEVIAPHYDLDPQLVTGRALGRVLAQLREESCLSPELPPLDVLDVGFGTGTFLVKLRQATEREIHPHGLDLSEQMAAVAKTRLPDLVAAIDDAANLDCNFLEQSFDLISTHFVTGFVPIDHLAPRIWEKLKPGGYWSFAGATSSAFPELQRKAQNRLLRLLFAKGRRFNAAEMLTPVNCEAVESCFRKHAFEVCSAETFQPELSFHNFDEFMEFGYRGSWLTAFIEEVGLQHAGKLVRGFLNVTVFPLNDKHCVAIALARKPRE